MIKDSTPNFAVGRGKQKIEGIVIHTTDGNFEGAKSWIKNKESQVSYHYIVEKNGRITQFVDEADTSWHAGKVVKGTAKFLKEGVNPNQQTVGIAFAGTDEIGPTLQQITAIAILVRIICDKYNLTLDENHIVGHNKIRSDKLCPGAKCSIPAIVYLASLSQV